MPIHVPKPLDNKTPKILPLAARRPHLKGYSHPSADPTYHPKRHPDPISRFSAVHFADRQTDKQTESPTDGLGDKAVTTALTLYYIDRE